MQLGVGFTVAYLVYTIGTLITAPATLAAAPAIAGGIPRKYNFRQQKLIYVLTNVYTVIYNHLRN